MTKKRGSKILKVYPTDYAKKDFREQVDFLSSYLANVSDESILFLLVKNNTEWIQEAFQAKRIRSMLTERTWTLQSESDVYISVNSFCDTNRLIGNVHQFQNCYLDLDYRKHGKTASIQNMTEQEITKLFLKKCEERHIPKPNFVIHTGNGLHVWWQLEPLASNWSTVWNYIQRSLHRVFKDFGADSNCLDAARVLRIPGTKNGKQKNNEKKVTVTYTRSRLIKAASLYNAVNRYQKEQNAYSVQKLLPKHFHTMPVYQILSLLEDIMFCSKYGVEDWACPVQYQENQLVPQNTVKKVSHGKAKERDTSMYPQRWVKEVTLILSDLERLVQLRKGKMMGYRNVLLFEYYSLLCFARNISNTTHAERKEKLLELNRCFDIPLPEHEVVSITNKPIRCYRIKNDTLIEKLNITIEEQCLLELVQCYEVKLAKKRNFAPSRQENRTAKIQQVAEGIIAGLTVNEIAAKIKSSSRTVYNYIKQYNLKVEAPLYCSEHITGSTKNTQSVEKATAGFAKDMLKKVSKSTRNRTKQKKLSKNQKENRKKLKSQTAIPKVVRNMENARLYLSAAFLKIQSLIEKIEQATEIGDMQTVLNETRLLQNIFMTISRVSEQKKGKMKSSLSILKSDQLLTAFKVVDWSLALKNVDILASYSGFNSIQPALKT